MNRRKIASVTAVSLVLGGLAVIDVAGCNLIVAAGDYQIVPSDATTAPGEDAPTGPALDAGEDTNQVVTAMDSGSDMNAPDTNLPDTGPGTCGSTVPITSVDFQQLLLSCVLDQGCQLTASTYSVGLCVSYNLLKATSGLTNCESAATNCAYIASCTGAGWTGLCDGGPAVYSCDDQNRLEDCPGIGYEESFTDCNRLGGTCTTYVDESDVEAGVVGGCAIATQCTHPVGGGDSCTSNNFLYSCIDKEDGGTVGVGYSCNTYSATCEYEDGGDGTSCYYMLPSCDPATTSPCDGNVGQQCYSTGLQRFDCSAAGLTCSPTADTFTQLPFTCTAAACDPTQCLESCNGTIATFCIGGAPVTFDCAGNGLSMLCDDSQVADENGNDYMECKPF